MENVSVESFAYKGESSLYKGIVDIISKERQMGKTSKTQISTSGLVELIKKETGINISKIEIVDGKYSFAISVSLLSGKNINTSRFYIDLMKDAVIDNDDIFTIDNLERKNEWHGLVDLKNHKVSGVFSKVPNILYLSNDDIYKDYLTPEEVAACILHEIGHAIYGFLTMSQIVTFNAVVHSINEQLKDIDQPDSLKFKLIDIGNLLKLPKEDADAIARAKTTDEGYNVLLTTVAEKIKGSTGQLDIDRTFNESYADIFAIRNGAGPALFSGLAKIMKEYKTGYRSKTMNNIIAVGMQLCISLLPGLYVGLASGIMVSIPIVSAVAAVLLTGTIIFDGSGGGDVYEDPKERLSRIKMDILGELRLKISKDRRVQLNEQLLLMNKTLAIINDDRVAYIEFLKSLRAPFRKYRSDQERERVLQQIGRNDLILASSVLKEIV